MKNRIAIIPARSGSKRIPNKNIKEINGKPMLTYVIETLIETNLYDEIHVSTDSQEYANLAIKNGASVPFLRDKYFSQDNTPLISAVRWVLNQYKNNGVLFESTTIITPCSPLISVNDLLSAQQIYDSHNGSNPVLSVAKYPSPPEWSFEENESGILVSTWPKLLEVRSQDLKEKYYDTGNFSIQNCKTILDNDFIVASNFLKYEISPFRAIDVDSPEDFERLEFVFKALKK